MMKSYQLNSYLFGANAPYVEELYESYLDNPGSVPDKWRAYFDQLQILPAADGSETTSDVAHAPIVESFAQRAKANAFLPRVAERDLSIARKQVHVQSIIAAYRFLGARWADLDPLKRQERPAIPELEPGFYDLTESDLDTTFRADNLYFGQEQMTLREIIKGLRDTYCGTLGAEYMTSRIQRRNAGFSSAWNPAVRRRNLAPRRKNASWRKSRQPKASSATCIPSM